MFSPPAKTVAKPAPVTQKKQAFDDSDEDDFVPPAKLQPAPAKQAPVKKAPVVASDDEDDF
jgi:hypothetical protein